MSRKRTASEGIGYVRVSTVEQVTGGVSLTAQREKIVAYCAMHELDLVAVHEDAGLSGKRADNRPGLQRAIDDACERRAPLIVHSLSRLARSTRDAIEIADRMGRVGADLVSITERIDTTSGMGRFFFTTVAALAQLERDLIGERTAAALAHKRRKHERVSHAVPFGFDLDGDGVRLVENPQEQRAARRIVALRAAGRSAREIIAELDRAGIRSKHGGRWHPKVVLAIASRHGVASV